MGIQKMLLPKWFHLKLKKEGGTSQKGHHQVHTLSQNPKVHQRLSKLLPLLHMYVSLLLLNIVSMVSIFSFQHMKILKRRCWVAVNSSGCVIALAPLVPHHTHH